MEWLRPRNVCEIQDFLGHFVRGYSQLMKPFTELTKKDWLLRWTDLCEEAFIKLKQILLGPEVMAYPMEKGDLFLDTDACDSSTRAVLSQIQNGRE